MANELTVHIMVTTVDDDVLEREFTIHAHTKVARSMILTEQDEKIMTKGYKHYWPNSDSYSLVPTHRIKSVNVSFPDDEEEPDGT